MLADGSPPAVTAPPLSGQSSSTCTGRASMRGGLAGSGKGIAAKYSGSSASARTPPRRVTQFVTCTCGVAHRHTTPLLTFRPRRRHVASGAALQLVALGSVAG
ncbi:MAG: hypothetical protein SGPRY_004397 [Prymnesium sp.]